VVEERKKEGKETTDREKRRTLEHDLRRSWNVDVVGLALDDLER